MQVININYARKMQKYKKIVRGCKSNPGGVKIRNKKARRAKKPKPVIPVIQLLPCARVLAKPATCLCLHKNENS